MPPPQQLGCLQQDLLDLLDDCLSCTNSSSNKENSPLVDTLLSFDLIDSSPAVADSHLNDLNFLKSPPAVDIPTGYLSDLLLLDQPPPLQTISPNSFQVTANNKPSSSLDLLSLEDCSTLR